MDRIIIRHNNQKHLFISLVSQVSSFAQRVSKEEDVIMGKKMKSSFPAIFYKILLVVCPLT